MGITDIDLIKALLVALPDAYPSDGGVIQGTFQNGRGWLLGDEADQGLDYGDELPERLHLQVYQTKEENWAGLAFNDPIYILSDATLTEVIEALIRGNHDDFGQYEDTRNTV